MRPKTGSSLLQVSGSRPPSRASTAGVSSSGRTTSGQGNALQALMHTLVKKMREKFGEAASNLECQELISQEVQNFVTVSKSVKEEDLSHLEERIRRRLTGATPVRTGLVAEKHESDINDEWARIWKFSLHKGELEENRKRELSRRKQQEIKETLDAQVREQENRKRAEQCNEKEYAQAEKEALRIWKENEAEKMKKKHEEIERLKAHRKGQLDEREKLREDAMRRKQQEEERLLSKFAQESKMEIMKEEQQREKERDALHQFLKANEVNKKMRQEMKEKEMKEDLDYMNAYAEMLEKQEQARKEQMEKLKKIQAKQEEDAKDRPPAKRWVDAKLIEKHYNAREAALKAEDERRLKMQADRKMEMIEVLQKQKEEKRSREEAAKVVEMKYAKEYIERGHAEEEQEREKRKQALQQKILLRLELEQQMRDNALSKKVSHMSKAERLLNSQLLKDVDEYERHKTVGA